MTVIGDSKKMMTKRRVQPQNSNEEGVDEGIISSFDSSEANRPNGIGLV